MTGHAHDNYNPRLHRFAVVVAGATLILLFAGASVTSTGSGLAVPDWPLSFGQVFPPMVGGVLYEHGHRMIAGVVLALTVALTVWLFRARVSPTVKRVGLVAFVLLVAQAVLGGLTVLLRLPTWISVSHAGMAQVFFCLIVTVAVMTSRGWRQASADTDATDTTMLRRLATVTTGVIYLQILIGAFMRHTGAGLAIPDFPLSYGKLFPPYISAPILVNYAHRVGALIVLLCVMLVAIEVMRNHRDRFAIARPGMMLVMLTGGQIMLGAFTIWTQRGVIPTTLHVGLGAAVLATSLVLTLRAFRGATAHAARSADAGIRDALAAGAVGGMPGGKS